MNCRFDMNRERTSESTSNSIMPGDQHRAHIKGQITGVTRADRNIAHRLIEEFMLSLMSLWPAHLEQAAIPSLYRIHELPGPEERFVKLRK